MSLTFNITLSYKQSREAYYASKNSGNLDNNLAFAYAVDLLRTSKTKNLETAVKMFEELFCNTSDDGFQRDCLFYIAVGCTKLTEYKRAIECCENILKVEPKNHQTCQLKKEIERRIRRDGITGIAAISGAVVGAAALIGLGIGLAKRK
ncbi:unnamed protein product [Calicophoron daubneyi]|uniref:Mitochondrial fission 1 protein n=1 Tax=Calicophoron daubneyi TaxID=300641 RepID=A0AAV2T8E4_CALDB